MRKAIVFLVIFVILSMAQKVTGIGSQPQLACQLRNTFQMKTSIKRTEEDSNADSNTPQQSIGMLDNLFRKFCKRNDESNAGTSKLKMLASPLKSFFISKKTTNESLNNSKNLIMNSPDILQLILDNAEKLEEEDLEGYEETPK